MSRHALMSCFVALIVITAACSSTSTNNSKNSTTTAESSENTERISPLGLGQPDPEQILSSALSAFEAGQSAEFLSYFAFRDANGRHFVPDPNDAKASGGADMKQFAPVAATLSMCLNSDFATVQYGRPINVGNSPPTVEVPMTTTYDFRSLSESRRKEILAATNDMLQRSGKSQGMNWDQFVQHLRSLPRTASRRFIYLYGQWRFDATWKSAQ